MSSINVTVNDTVLTSPTSLRDTSATSEEVLKKLADYFKNLHMCGTCAVTIRVSTTAPVRAAGTITAGGVGTADKIITLGATVLTLKASAANENQVTIGGTATITATNITNAINVHSVASKLFIASKPTATTVLVTALTPGLVGNGIVFSTDDGAVTANGSGYLGATTAGAGNDDATLLRIKGPSSSSPSVF